MSAITISNSNPMSLMRSKEKQSFDISRKKINGFDFEVDDPDGGVFGAVGEIDSPNRMREMEMSPIEFGRCDSPDISPVKKKEILESISVSPT